MNKILIATGNKGKFREFKRLFSNTGIEITSLADFPKIDKIEETGKDFIENAMLKAKYVAKAFQVVTLGEDSGLVVPALNGRPGIYSARYAGEGASDKDNIKKLIEEISNLPEEKRDAYYKAVIVVYRPDDKWISAEGTCHGKIITSPRGSEGFGYDPIFYLPELNKTMAEISPKEKDRYSHRGEAVRKIIPRLKRFLG